MLHNALVLLVTNFFLVFFIGLQANYATKGKYTHAVLASLGLGASNILIINLAISIDNLGLLFYLLGGSLGICTSILIAKWVK